MRPPTSRKILRNFLLLLAGGALLIGVVLLLGLWRHVRIL